MQRRVQLESGEQVVLAQWLDLTGALWCHVPNGGSRDGRTGAMLKRHGVKRGVPDALIFDVPDTPDMKIVRGVALELKTGSRLTEFQKDWAYRLRRAGWMCLLANGADDAIKKLSELGYSPTAVYERRCV